MLRILVDSGTGFDCASVAEIELILNMEKDAERIIFANPCKPISHIKYAKEHQVQVMTVDNREEIEKIAKHFPEAKYDKYFYINEGQSPLCL